MKIITTILALGLFSVCFGQTVIEETGSWCTTNLILEANLEEGAEVLYWSKDEVHMEDQKEATLACAAYGHGVFNIHVKRSDGSLATISHEVLKPTIIADFKGTNYLAAAVTYFEGTTETTEAIVAWEWGFGNGETANIQNPKVMLKEQKLHTITLTVTSESGCKQVITKKHEWAY